MRTRLAVGAALGSIALGAWFAACGIDENGTLPTNDGSVADVAPIEGGNPDVITDAGPPVLNCLEAGTPIDASCLGQPVPDGWQPMGVQSGVVIGCDAGFNAAPFVENPQVPTGACQCTGCAPSVPWTCGVTITAGNTCTAVTIDASASGCYGNNINHVSFGEDVTRFGNPACNGGQQIGTGDASSTPVSTCSPQDCASDFCSLASQGFKLCIWNKAVTDGGCPTNFPQSHIVGAKADVTCDNCQQCALANPNAACTGSVTAYQNNNCGGSNYGTSSSDGVCASASNNFASIYYDAGPVPVPNCGSTTGIATGKPSLEAPSTICCTQ